MSLKGKDAAPGKVNQDTSELHARESQKAVDEQAAHKARVSSLEPSLPPHPGAPPAVRKPQPPVPVPPVKAPAKTLSDLISKPSQKAFEPAKKK